MFYLIGLGLSLESISKEAIELCKKSKIYLETYTVAFPYNIQKLEGIVGKIVPLTRMLVEDEKFLEEAKDKDITLLVYGSPLMATTHISLLLKCKELGIDYQILQNGSIFDAVAETGLQFYKFGKTGSMPAWKENYKPDSFMEIIKDNQKIKAHSLLLIDIGLTYGEALKQFEEAMKNKNFKTEKLIVCSKLGTRERKIFYDSVDELYGKEVHEPFCFIIPSNLHFLEEEAIQEFKNE